MAWILFTAGLIIITTTLMVSNPVVVLMPTRTAPAGQRRCTTIMDLATD